MISPFPISNFISKVGVQGEPVPGQGYDWGHQVSPGQVAMPLMCQPQPFQLQRHCNRQAPIHRSIRGACREASLSCQAMVLEGLSQMLRAAQGYNNKVTAVSESPPERNIHVIMRSEQDFLDGQRRLGVQQQAAYMTTRKQL